MALDVTIRGLPPAGSDSGFSFDNDGYYWFMHPWFEALAEQTGKYIDLYGRAEFSTVEFGRLRKITAEVRREVLERPPTWEVTTGWQTHPEKKEIRREVSRAEFSRLLDDFERLIEEASVSGESIEFLGD